MQFVKLKGVYSKVPRQEALNGGHKVIGARWLDINKGDDREPNYRARLVGKEIKTDSRLDLFAATPPLEAIKVICSICASHQHGKQPRRIMSIDVKRAYFYARTLRPVFIEIPIEDWEEGDESRVARLNWSLYGTRDAAKNWTEEYTRTLTDLGFAMGRASTCSFHHAKMQLFLSVHGDYFTITGPDESLTWLEQQMSRKYEVKCERLGPGGERGYKPEIRVLNRTLRWRLDGIQYEPDQRHVEMIVQAVGVSSAKSVSTPIVTMPKENIEDEEEKEVMNKEAAGQ